MEDARLRPAPPWVAPLFAVLGAGTIPWTVYLSMTLPDHARTHNYRLAWVGFDVLLIVALLITAFLAWRGSPLVGLLAGCTATMLIVDAWFDVTTSNRQDVGLALLLAIVAEIPLAILCGWVALHVDRVLARRIRLVARLRRAGIDSRAGIENWATTDGRAATDGRVDAEGQVGVDSPAGTDGQAGVGGQAGTDGQVSTDGPAGADGWVTTDGRAGSEESDRGRLG